MTPAKFWYLYLIECLDGSIYTGITVDVAARYAAHLAGKGARYGLECLARCLSFGLEARWRDDLYLDFIELTLWDYRRGHLYVLEKLWALYKYRKSSHAVDVPAAITEALAPYPTAKHFALPELQPAAVANADRLPLPAPSRPLHGHHGHHGHQAAA